MAYDFAPLFRSAIGFDRLAQLVDTATQNPVSPSYPPYNIEKLSDAQYALTMAVAGFGPDDIELTVQDNTLIVSGRVGDAPAQGREMLYRGIATRAFERRFVLADHVVVESADLTNGLLRIAVRQIVPEALKPRRIPVSSGRAMAGNEAAATDPAKAGMTHPAMAAQTAVPTAQVAGCCAA
ncbi:Hsp20 family protein [Komagataeibacter medellinensis]|uniref:Heat shock protein Hsp20 n=1 Tax=Komagataeibacter medellinensis (strain NBRC 3288 / BCRC 11682 / LMG 1693 / Kondo 51) TaxID=634177 RepID=G2I3G0_KOMMN|nr:Hsp20 family protein [Komagataeibacter medellinensis]BAK85127.1 heat shock protein Hsp20 [Komagataeibacter medellinensis NBRC 3288]